MKKVLFFFFIALYSIASDAQIIITAIGNGLGGFSGDGGQATAAAAPTPSGVVIDAVGNIYVSDYTNHIIRKVSPGGIINTIAGIPGSPGYSGDGGQATNAKFTNPNKITLDAAGNLYVADFGNNVVRKITPSGIISTFAGTGIATYNGDGIPATTANLYHPSDVTFDRSGNLYIADYSHYLIRKVSPSGIISTVAGNGYPGSTGDGGPAVSASLNCAYAIVLDTLGNLYITDATNNKIRKVTPSPGGIITTFAGTGTPGSSGDGGQATAAQLSNPAGIDIDPSGNIYIADDYNNKIRKVSPVGIITTIAGNGTAGYAGDMGSATAAEINHPDDIFIDIHGSVFISDDFNNRVRKIAGCISDFSLQPVNDTVLLGGTAKFWVSSILATPIYQWQQNAGSGWVNMANTWPYSGVTTDTLTIHNASMYIDTTWYRCYIFDDANPCGDTSSSAILYIRPVPAGLRTIAADEINIYPNPAQDNFTILIPGPAADASLQLINELGQIVAMQKIQDKALVNIGELPSGIYIARIHIGSRCIYRKVVKQ